MKSSFCTASLAWLIATAAFAITCRSAAACQEDNGAPLLCPLFGEWTVVSATTEVAVVPVANHKFFFSEDFISERQTLTLSTGDTQQVLLFDVVWNKDEKHDQKWTATLHTNPDPALGLKKQSDDTIAGFVTCWVVSDSAVVVFSENGLNLETADIRLLSDSSSGFKIYSLSRESDDPGELATHSDAFLRLLTDDYRHTLDDATRRLHGGWVKRDKNR